MLLLIRTFFLCSSNREEWLSTFLINIYASILGHNFSHYSLLYFSRIGPKRICNWLRIKTQCGPFSRIFLWISVSKPIFTCSLWLHTICLNWTRFIRFSWSAFLLELFYYIPFQRHLTIEFIAKKLAFKKKCFKVISVWKTCWICWQYIFANSLIRVFGVYDLAQTCWGIVQFYNVAMLVLYG